MWERAERYPDRMIKVEGRFLLDLRKKVNDLERELANTKNELNRVYQELEDAKVKIEELEKSRLKNRTPSDSDLTPIEKSEKIKPTFSNEDSVKLQGNTESIYKVIVIGDPECGKTELLAKFATDISEDKNLPTVGVSILKKQITLDKINKTINLMFWDIAGQPQFYMLHRPYFIGADGVILVFDTTRSSTFSNVNNWWQSCVKYGLSGVPRILVGINNDAKSESERKIINPMVQNLSKKLNAPYFEVSLATGENVTLVFQRVAELLYAQKNEKDAT